MQPRGFIGRSRRRPEGLVFLEVDVVMSVRLKKLETMLEKTPNDAFLLYGVALEYKSAGRYDEAIKFLNRTLEVDPAYCYAYFQSGQVYEMTGDTEAARNIYEAGIDAAKKKGDAHAESEIRGALESL